MKTLKEATAGKSTLRLVEVATGKFVGVAITGAKVTCRVDGNDRDEVWLRLHEEAGKGSPNYFGFDGAINRFREFFPLGFADPQYLKDERDYKVAAAQRLQQELPLEAAIDGTGYGEAAVRIFRATNLLFPVEKARAVDVLRSPQADAFIQAAARFTRGDHEQGLRQMLTALKGHDAAKWTIVTYLPYLWQPAKHMFLKPEVTKAFAERVGHPFKHEYSSDLDVAVYRSLLDLTQAVEKAIGDLGPRDNVDLQSFIWVVGEYRKAKD